MTKFTFKVLDVNLKMIWSFKTQNELAAFFNRKRGSFTNKIVKELKDSQFSTINFIEDDRSYLIFMTDDPEKYGALRGIKRILKKDIGDRSKKEKSIIKRVEKYPKVSMRVYTQRVNELMEEELIEEEKESVVEQFMRGVEPFFEKPTEYKEKFLYDIEQDFGYPLSLVYSFECYKAMRERAAETGEKIFFVVEYLVFKSDLPDGVDFMFGYDPYHAYAPIYLSGSFHKRNVYDHLIVETLDVAFEHNGYTIEEYENQKAKIERDYEKESNEYKYRMRDLERWKLRSLTDMSSHSVSAKVEPGNDESGLVTLVEYISISDANIATLGEYFITKLWLITEDNLKKNIKAKNKKPRKTGGFFPFINQTSYDLTSLAIYNKAKVEVKNCFVYAMENSGKFNEIELREIAESIKTERLTLSSIGQIAKQYNTRLNIKILENVSKKQNSKTINPKGERVIDLGLIEGHYFLDVVLPFSYFSIKNYDEIKDLNNFQKIKKRKNNKFLVDNKVSITAFKAVKTMLENPNILRRMTLEELSKTCQIRKAHDIENLEYSEKSVIPVEFKESKTDYRHVYFADFETAINEEGVHKEFLISFIKANEPNSMKSFYEENCAYKFLDSLETKSLIYFHNLGFDFLFLFDKVKVVSMIKKGSQIKSVLCVYKNKVLTFKDSWSILPNKLKDFNKTLKLGEVFDKEVMPYKFYSHDRVFKVCPMEDIEKVAKEYISKKDREHFINTCKYKFGMNNKFDEKIYAIYYCEQDVKILEKGLLKFRDMIKQITDLDVYGYVSLPSIADAFIKKTGCYDDCYKIANAPQMFISKCVLGGRVMTKNNKKIDVEGVINDFDAVSLYPSAMHLVDTFTKGKPKILTDEMITKIENQEFDDFSAFYVQIIIESIETERDFPLIYRRTKQGVVEYTNDAEYTTMFVGDIYLKDMIKHHGIKYQVLRGYYFDEGFNNKIKDVIELLFNERVKYKKQGNPIEQVYKLFLNAIYGKTIQKPVSYDYKIVYGFDDYIDYVFIHNPVVISTNKAKTGDIYIVKMRKPTNTHYNAVHIGSRILDASKFLMNRVFYAADEVGANIYYQDTDSMHIEDGDIARVKDKFKELNPECKDLIGSGLGQYHSDFSVIPNEDMTKEEIANLPGANDLYSSRLIALAKKCYIDILKQRVNENDDEETKMRKQNFNAYHIRMKGVSSSTIIKKAKDEYDGKIEDLYKKLYNGKSVTFDLASSQVMMKKDNSFGIKNICVFERKMKFL